MLADVVPEWCTIIAPTPSSIRAGKHGSGAVATFDEGASLERSSEGELRPSRPKEVVRLNARIHFREVRQMVVFMSGGSDDWSAGKHTPR